MKDFTPEDFSNVDRAPDAGFGMLYLDRVHATDLAMAYKRQTFALLGVAEGARLLDVGCGTGEDVLALARCVGTTGRVVGVDNSAAMVAESRQRAAGSGLPVAFQRGDARRLDFAADTFDGCRADRTFQHLDDPDAALAELVRVARPGGRIVVSDPDWETLVVDAPDPSLTRRILHALCDAIASGWVGRRLPGLFRAAGLAEIAVIPVTMVLTDSALAGQLLLLERAKERAREVGAVTAAEADAWWASLDAAARAGRFFASLTGFIVSGQKP